MRLALIILGVLAAGDAAAQSRGLDHRAHAEAVSKAGGDSGCETCHPDDSSGRLRKSPDHATCFSRCHGPMPRARRPGQPYEIDSERRPLCLVCHAAAALEAAERGDAKKLTPAAPPADRQDYLLSMSHRDHAGAGCGDCHGFGTRPRAHDRCRGCHARPAADLAMTVCQGCHRPAGKSRRALGSEPSPYSTRAGFSHQKHAPRLGGKPCLTCHVGLDQLAQNKVPRPRKSTCAGCHDGKTAFSTTEARCRECHRNPPIPVGDRQGGRSRFEHAVHSGTGDDEGATPCLACHPGGGRFDTSVGHTRCAAAGCHATDYARRVPEVCDACHLGSEPWLDQHVDRPPRSRGDFGIRFDHAAHPARACSSCHIGDPDGVDAGLASGHAGCSGAGCHDAVAPTMQRCGGCHQIGARDRRRRAADSRPWSVRRAFRHALHRERPDGQALACNACHREASSPGPLPAPAKSTCLGCHDGEPAFKATGHGCARCHIKTARGSR